ncbi:muramoyltetrapeptide carboxypeptidase [Ulvibacter sp. MAR_2010_11]|uniref:S66 peptidase family protein n=1 Tax=Ulvibacter sp. MAR_2010_11 TaxID=1250229 RepID=UPI000C2C760A|nr:LD-carboxypeptidase [Ulvibacter sp. MAR_2010_11]PKA83076.1 muramoyltetrapeptide carboxypeptidase [Ulvibacter sp. MAR_2010_11]
MTTPPFLQKGDTVGIVSTARKISKEELQPFLQLLESWGLQAKLGISIEAEAHQFAGDDTLRAKDFQNMMDDASVKAIWCARGGYGTVRIIDRLNFSEFKKNPKWIVGYSDVTVLHSHVHNFNIESVHANMAMEIDSKTEATRTSVRDALFGKDFSIEYASEGKLNRNGTTSGMLVGGNLSLLYSLCGSSSAINTAGKILFIEDLDEYLYHIDRMMQNLKRNGYFENLKGLIVGGMSDMRDNTKPFGKSAEEIISETVSEYTFPLCFHLPAGHIQDNRALILGRMVDLKVEPKIVKLKFSNPKSQIPNRKS